MLLTIGLINNLGRDEAVSRCSNEKGLVIARKDAFDLLFPGETIGTRRMYTINAGTSFEDTFDVTTLRAGLDPMTIWKAKGDR